MIWRHSFLLIFDLLSVILFTGIVFGWTSLLEILLDEGFYKALCPPGTPLPCDAQKTALNRAFTIASTAVSLVALPGGAFLDKFGPLWTILISGFVEVLGLIGIAVSEQMGSVNVDIFLFSFIAIAVGGANTMFCGYSLAFLFPERSSLILGLTSCFFDGSCIIFPIFKLLYNAGISFNVLFWGYVIVAVFVYGMLFVAWAQNNAEMTRVRTLANSQAETGITEGLAALPIRRQMQSREFVAMLIFSAVQLTRSNLFLGVVNDVNSQIASESGSSESLSSISTVVGLIIPFGFLAVPLFTSSLKWFGLIGTLQLTNGLGMTYNAMQFIPNLYSQLGSVAVFTVWRAFLFSIICDFNASTFGILSMGTIQGFCFLGGALVNLSQAPLVAWSVNVLQGNFRPLLLVSLIAGTPLALLWVWVQCSHSRRGTSMLSADDRQVSRRPSIRGTACGDAENFAVQAAITRLRSRTDSLSIQER